MKKGGIIYHIISWSVLYVLWIAVFQNRSFELTRTLTVEFCYLVFISLDYYLVIYYLIPRVLHGKGYVYFLCGSILLLGVSAMLRARLALFMNAHVFMTGGLQPSFLNVFENSVVNIGIWVIILCCAKILWDRNLSQKYLASIEHEKALTELNFLKAQINPHFLFNSLNSIYGNIDKTNKTARTLLLKLSELLRYQLYECNVERIIMLKEIEYIRNYVSLQQYRKEEDLIIDLNIDEALNKFMIAPLMLVVFIENAFKHVSVFDDRPNKIEIRLLHSRQSLNFEISNTADEKQKDVLTNNNGIGIVNVKRRLELQYPGKHGLEITRSPGFYKVNLKIDLE